MRAAGTASGCTDGEAMDLSGVIAIARPIDEVFAAWAALERAPEHAEGIVERRSLED